MTRRSTTRPGESPGRSGTGSRPEVIVRHSAFLRLTHWINALAIFVMVGSGLNIFNAHPRLYWGQAGANADPAWLEIGATHAPGALHGGGRGVLTVGGLHLPTTGVLGWSRQGADWVERGFPQWITLPSFTDLADARRWHFSLAWVLALNALAYLVWALVSRHLQRDLWPTRADLRALPQDVVDHLRNRHPTGEAAKRYNVLQKLAYLGLILLVAGMIATGMTLSPGLDAAFPGLLDLFGGRQSARSLHFIFATGVVLFILVHLAQVVLAGPLNEIRSITTGRFRVPQPHRGSDAYAGPAAGERG